MNIIFKYSSYDYTDLCTDVTKFPRPRFASEFGFQSYPSFETMKEISIAEVVYYLQFAIPLCNS